MMLLWLMMWVGKVIICHALYMMARLLLLLLVMMIMIMAMVMLMMMI